jgi:hypothetical protein
MKTQFCAQADIMLCPAKFCGSSFAEHTHISKVKLFLWHHVVLWYDSDVSLHPEGGGSMELWNVGIQPQHYDITTQKTLTWITTMKA